jgi:hypothetical protein
MERIEMNVLPEDVNSSEKSQAVLDLMKDIAGGVEKGCLLSSGMR